MTLERRYWDSDCFLAWLKSEEEKVELCRQVLIRAAAGGIQIITSTLTIAEVLDLRGHEKIGKDRRQQVIDFFKKSYITPVTITRRIAENSRELVWDHGIKPKDALHVATALHAQIPLLNTFDSGLISKSKLIGSPPLVIEKPRLDQPDLPGT